MARLPPLALVVFAALLVTQESRADAITLIHEGRGSGTLDGVAFADLDFVITASGDTDDRVEAIDFFSGEIVGYRIVHTRASISIAGLGDFAFVSATKTYANAALGRVDLVGFSRDPGGGFGGGLFDGPGGFVFGDWEMLTSVGPISSLGSLQGWSPALAPVVTDAGVLIFDDATGVPTTFQAIVPEPATALLLAGGLSLLAFRPAQRRRSA